MEPKPSSHPENLKLRAISDGDFDRLVGIDEEYLSAGREKLTKWRAEYPRLFRGAFVDEELVGICHPKPSSGARIILEGIGPDAPMRPDSLQVKGKVTVLRFDVDVYVPELRDALKAHYGADHAIFIFAKGRPPETTP